MQNPSNDKEVFPGLTEAEVQLSRQRFGENATDSEKDHRFTQVLVEVVTEPLFIILVLTSMVYFLLGEYSEGLIMLVALILVSGISLFQENRSRNAVDALKKLASPLAKVMRNGKLTRIDSAEIVIDDLISVEDGDIVPADALILKLNDFSVMESMLTGESLPIFKELNHEHNLIYQGTQVISGYCLARVTAIGKETQFGKIGATLQGIKVSKTPMQEQIKRFVRSMVSIGVFAFLIVWALNYYLTKDILQSLLSGLTLAMSILPEEIPVAFSTFMALGAYHLYKKQVIARSPYAVETLGTASVICIDKTGTITENSMQVAMIYDYKENREINYADKGGEDNEVLDYAMWASETQPFDPMEKSIHKIYSRFAPKDERPDFKMFKEYPLSGKPPIMTHAFNNKQGTHIIACKGALEGILKLCDISADQKTTLYNKAMALASKGYRVLGVSKSELSANQLPKDQHDIKFDFLGIIAFNDPPKKNMADILQQFYDAGIKVKMITGDYTETAVAIANQINFKPGESILTGTEVMEMDASALRDKVSDTNIFARMFPEAKLKVIEALKANGEVVAMTGDGVNDAPALKAAHIGIAMGKRGSEVAKNAASLILVDDDLVHMTEAVAVGRRIYENLKKAIQYIISIHIPIILIVTLPLILFWKFHDIFSPIHVIILELIMGLPVQSFMKTNRWKQII